MSENGLKEKLEEIMKSFGEPFVSEADFQFSLSKKLQEELPKSEIILEYPVKIDDEDVSIDICVKIDNTYHFIELKYKTKYDKFISKRFEEERDLKKQGGHNQGRYLFIKDIEKMEKIRKKYKGAINYCIFLTNDETYKEKGDDSIDKNFSLTNIIPANKELCREIYKSKVGVDIKKYIVKLENSYECEWEDLKEIKTEKGTLFRYLLITIPPERKIDKLRFELNTQIFPLIPRKM